MAFEAAAVVIDVILLLMAAVVSEEEGVLLLLRAIGRAEVVERALLEAASSGRQRDRACTDCAENI